MKRILIILIVSALLTGCVASEKGFDLLGGLTKGTIALPGKILSGGTYVITIGIEGDAAHNDVEEVKESE